MNTTKKINIVTLYAKNKLNTFVKLKEKKPTSVGWNKNPLNHNEIIDWIKNTKQQDDNVGFVVPKGLLIVDVDIKDGGKGNESLINLQKDTRQNFITTVNTISGGKHIYITIPNNVTLPTHNKKYPNIDFLGYRKQCVMPESTIDGKKYHLHGHKLNINKANEFFINHLKEVVVQNEKLDLKTQPETQPERQPERQPENLKQHDKKEKIYTKIEVNAMLSNIDPSIEYDKWLRVLMALHNWDNVVGYELAQSWSEKSKEKYNKNEVNKKWNSFSNNNHNIKIGTLILMSNKAKQEQDGKKVIIFDDITLTQNKEYAELIFIKTDGKSGTIFNSHNKTIVGIESFKTTNLSKEYNSKKYKSLLDKLLQSGVIKVADYIGYNPNKKRLYKDKNCIFANSFSISSFTKPIKPKKDSKEYWGTQDFIDHIKYICGDHQQTQIILNWMAHQYQKPGVLLRWMPVLIGEQGIGKSIIISFLRQIIGIENVGNPDSNIIKTDFNEYAMGKCVNVIEEFKLTRDNTEILKTIISDEHVLINAKGKREMNIPNVTNYFANSNYNNCVNMSSGHERRYCLLKSPITQKTTKSGTYFANLYKNVCMAKNAIAFYLSQREIPDSFYTGQAPMTEFKRERMAYDADTILGRPQVEAILKAGCFLIQNNCFSFTSLSLKVRAVLDKTKISEYALRKIINALGFKKIGRLRIRIDEGKRHQVYCNDEKMTPEQMQELLNETKHFEPEGWNC